GAGIAWDVINWSGVVAPVKEAPTGDTVLVYGSDRPLLPKLQFWSAALLQALSPFPWLAGLLAIVAACGLARAAARLGRGRIASLLRTATAARLLFALCLAGTIRVGLLTYSGMIGADAH